MKYSSYILRRPQFFCEISTVDLSYLVTVKSTVEISQNFVAFSEYMNFNLKCQQALWPNSQSKLIYRPQVIRGYLWLIFPWWWSLVLERNDWQSILCISEGARYLYSIIALLKNPTAVTLSNFNWLQSFFFQSLQIYQRWPGLRKFYILA